MSNVVEALHREPVAVLAGALEERGGRVPRDLSSFESSAVDVVRTLQAPAVTAAFTTDQAERLAARLMLRELRLVDRQIPAVGRVDTAVRRMLEVLPHAADIELLYQQTLQGRDYEALFARLHGRLDARIRLTLKSFERQLADRGFDIDDVVADVFRKLAEKPPNGPGNTYDGRDGEVRTWRDPVGVLYKWLHMVARHRALDIVGSSRPRSVSVDQSNHDEDAAPVQLVATDVPPDEALHQRRTLAALEKLTEKLSPALRAMAMSLIHRPDLTHEERARALGLLADDEPFERHRRRYDTQRSRARSALAKLAREHGYR